VRRWEMEVDDETNLKSEANFVLAKFLSWLLASPCCKVTVKLWVMMSRNMTKYTYDFTPVTSRVFP
jgi:hypothetical protein